MLNGELVSLLLFWRKLSYKAIKEKVAESLKDSTISNEDIIEGIIYDRYPGAIIEGSGVFQYYIEKCVPNKVRKEYNSKGITDEMKIFKEFYGIPEKLDTKQEDNI